MAARHPAISWRCTRNSECKTYGHKKTAGLTGAVQRNADGSITTLYPNGYSVTTYPLKNVRPVESSPLLYLPPGYSGEQLSAEQVNVNSLISGAEDLLLLSNATRKDGELAQEMLGAILDDGLAMADNPVLNMAGVSAAQVLEDHPSLADFQTRLADGLLKRAEAVASLAVRTQRIVDGHESIVGDPVAAFFAYASAEDYDRLGRTSLAADIVSFTPLLGNVISGFQAAGIQAEKPILEELKNIGVLSDAEYEARSDETVLNQTIAGAGMVGGFIGKGLGKAGKAAIKSSPLLTRAALKISSLLIKGEGIGSVVAGRLALGVARLTAASGKIGQIVNSVPNRCTQAHSGRDGSEERVVRVHFVIN